MDPFRKAFPRSLSDDAPRQLVPPVSSHLSAHVSSASSAFPVAGAGLACASRTGLFLHHRLGVNQLTSLRNTLAEDLDNYASHGVAAIGLNWRKLTDYGIRRSVRQIQKSGLPVSSLGWIGGFTGENGYGLQEILTEARRVIRVAGQVRAANVTVLAGPQAGHIRSHAVRLVVDGLRELADLAGTYQVQLALQPMHALFAKNWSFLNSLDETLQILDRVGDSRVKVAFGTYHLWEEPNLEERIAEIAPRIGLVSLADWRDAPRHENDRLLPGEGCLPLVKLVRALESRHYSGWYEMEVWSRDLWKLESRDLMRRCVAARERLSAQFAAS